MTGARRHAPWLIGGLVGWAGVAALGVSMLGQDPPRAGFDLRLLYEAGRRVILGETPYDPAMLGGTAPDAVELFYSYPPPVAQALAFGAWLPFEAVFLAWTVLAIAGLALVAHEIARRLGSTAPRTVAFRTVAASPAAFPWVIALLFGNANALFPLLYGAGLLAVLPGATARASRLGGLAVATMSLAKLHPAAIGLWGLVRATPWSHADPAERRRAVTSTVAAVIAGLAILAGSGILGGFGPWRDYLDVLRVGANADLVDARNMGPVSVLGQVTGLAAADLRAVQVAVALLAALGAAIAALRIRDTIASYAVATVASLVILPVTWYHYPVALAPVVIALLVGRPAARPLVIAAIVLATLAIALGPLGLWASMGLVVAAAFRAGPQPLDSR